MCREEESKNGIAVCGSTERRAEQSNAVRHDVDFFKITDGPEAVRVRMNTMIRWSRPSTWGRWSRWESSVAEQTPNVVQLACMHSLIDIG